MQEIDLLMKSINELEFIVAYQKHVISTSKCTCDTFMDNLRELYRIYTNSKILTQTLKNGINKLYEENLRLKNTPLISNEASKRFNYLYNDQNLNKCRKGNWTFKL